jgi:hypothetical protein
MAPTILFGPFAPIYWVLTRRAGKMLRPVRLCGGLVKLNDPESNLISSSQPSQI